MNNMSKNMEDDGRIREFLQKLQEMSKDYSDMNQITIREVAERISNRQLSVGEVIDVQARDYVSREIVYDIFEDHWADTSVCKVGRLVVPKTANITRFRYFPEGWRAVLPKIGEGHEHYDNLSRLIEEAMERE
jgi:hypothetical protein